MTDSFDPKDQLEVEVKFPNVQELTNTVNDGLTTIKAVMDLMPKTKSLEQADLFFSTGILWLSQALQELNSQVLAERKRVIREAAAKAAERAQKVQ